MKTEWIMIHSIGNEKPTKTVTNSEIVAKEVYATLIMDGYRIETTKKEQGIYSKELTLCSI